nr:MAG TPA: hypothetical protein [Caudoviricetes sp.]
MTRRVRFEIQRICNFQNMDHKSEDRGAFVRP